MKEIVSFDDIPQFTRVGNCNMFMHLEYLPKRIKEWEEDDYYALQMNPEFQRGHVWSVDQEVAFVEYLLKGGTAATTVYFNCPFWGGMAKGSYRDFVCVDGLQRVSAVQDFIGNKIKVFGKYYNEFEGKLDSVKYGLNVCVNNLKTEAEVLTWYIELNSGGTPHTKEEIDRVKGMLSRLTEV